MALIPMQDLYDAFFVLLESDEWEVWEEEAVNQDLVQLAKAATPWFKFPRCSIEWDGAYFVDEEITNEEIQIIAQFMKFIWFGRVVDSWENLRPFYTERDFSPGKMLDSFKEKQKTQQRIAEDLERVYYRSVKKNPFHYRKLAGRQ